MEVTFSDRVLRVYDLEKLKEPLNDKEEEEEEGGRKEEKGEGERGKGGKEIEVDPLQRLQDNVNRMQWKKCTFSGNGNNRFNISLSLIFALFIMFFNYYFFIFSLLCPSSLCCYCSPISSFLLSLSPPLGDGDYICAGSHRQHELYIWDKTTGNLVKILTGPKGESLLDLMWHPVELVILSVSNGLVNVMVTCSDRAVECLRSKFQRT